MIRLRLAAALVAAALAVAALVFGPAALTHLMAAKTSARVARGQGEAAIAAGADATATLSNLTAADATADRIAKEGHDALADIPDDGRGDAGGVATVDASCRLRLYRDLERCAAVRGSGAGGSAHAR